MSQSALVKTIVKLAVLKATVLLGYYVYSKYGEKCSSACEDVEKTTHEEDVKPQSNPSLDQEEVKNDVQQNVVQPEQNKPARKTSKKTAKKQTGEEIKKDPKPRKPVARKTTKKVKTEPKE